VFLVVSLSLVLVNGLGFGKIAEHINSARVGWRAEVPQRFKNFDDVRMLCGTWTHKHANYTNMNHPLSPFEANPIQAIPTEFDSRTNWPKCTVISHVRDQSACGSCWAFASTESFEDRRCIKTGQDILFSPEDTAGCCKGATCGFSMGCNGGQPSAALSWMKSTGVVTGGDYFNRTDASGGCKPYSLAPCAHHVPPTPKYPACPTSEYSLSCKEVCSDNASGKTYSSDKTKGSTVNRFSSVAAMQSAIMTDGPLAVAFTVYSDFPTYKSGVYVHSSGSALGGHAVEMVGWGTEGGVDYWLIKNSWNEQWGDGGFFKIKRGVDECGIENDVTGISF